jgi:hypothetical protein
LLTSPISAAVRPSIRSQVSRQYLARAIPRSSGQISAAWSPAVMPIRLWPSASTMSSPMMLMSGIS